MEYETGWADFSDKFIDRVIYVLASSSAPNIVRPATVIVRKLVIASPKTHGSHKGKAKARESDAVNVYGFDRIYTRINEVDYQDGHAGPAAERIFRPIVKRLEGTRDLEVVAQR